MLINSANSFQGVDIECILRAQITGVCGINLSTGFIIQLLLPKHLHLGFSEDNARFDNFGLQYLRVELEVEQITVQPDRANRGRRNKDALLAQLIEVRA